jgi:hypothetical protein
MMLIMPVANVLRAADVVSVTTNHCSDESTNALYYIPHLT